MGRGQEKKTEKQRGSMGTSGNFGGGSVLASGPPGEFEREERITSFYLNFCATAGKLSFCNTKILLPAIHWICHFYDYVL